MAPKAVESHLIGARFEDGTCPIDHGLQVDIMLHGCLQDHIKGIGHTTSSGDG